MTQRTKRWLVVLLAIVISVRMPAWSTSRDQAHGCCPAFRHDGNIQIADQKILIAWDPATQVEHFVREAGFTRSKQDQPDDDFGFLVPSPTQPTIETTDGLVFGRLRDAIEPKVVFKSKWQIEPIIGVLAPFLLANRQLMTSIDAELAPNSAVDVLESKQVAGYDVSVLRADDATALTNWLSANGYDSRPGLKAWAEPYVANGWIITAFKYSAQSSQQVEASAIRISFKTNRPVFPYRVPTDQITEPGKGHLLRTYVVGPGRASGTLCDLGSAGETTNSNLYLQGRLRYSMPIRGQQNLKWLDGVLPQDDLARYEQSWLTAFDDPTWPSSTQDLWFDFDPQAQSYQETHVVTNRRTIMLPIDLIALAAVLVIRRWRKS